MARPRVVFPDGELSPKDAERKDALERNRRWYARNKDEQRKRVRSWQSSNQQAVKSAWQSWSKKNSAHLSEKDRRRRATHREERLAHSHNWRARVAGAPGGGVTKEQWLQRLDEFGGKCAYCIAADGNTMDHIVPVSRGGAHDIENVVPACGSCNPRKSASSLLEFVARGGGLV